MNFALKILNKALQEADEVRSLKKKKNIYSSIIKYRKKRVENEK